MIPSEQRLKQLLSLKDREKNRFFFLMSIPPGSLSIVPGLLPIPPVLGRLSRGLALFPRGYPFGIRAGQSDGSNGWMESPELLCRRRGGRSERRRLPIRTYDAVSPLPRQALDLRLGRGPMSSPPGFRVYGLTLRFDQRSKAPRPPPGTFKAPRPPTPGLYFPIGFLLAGPTVESPSNMPRRQSKSWCR